MKSTLSTLGRGSAGSGCASSSSASTASAAASPGSSAPSSDMCGGCGSLTRQTTTTSSRTIHLKIIRILNFYPYGLQENVCNQAARKVCCNEKHSCIKFKYKNSLNVLKLICSHFCLQKKCLHVKQKLWA